MELLLPNAAMKLDLAYDIEPDVPPCEGSLSSAFLGTLQ